MSTSSNFIQYADSQKQIDELHQMSAIISQLNDIVQKRLNTLSHKTKANSQLQSSSDVLTNLEPSDVLRLTHCIQGNTEMRPFTEQRVPTLSNKTGAAISHCMELYKLVQNQIDASSSQQLSQLLSEKSISIHKTTTDMKPEITPTQTVSKQTVAPLETEANIQNEIRRVRASEELAIARLHSMQIHNKMMNQAMRDTTGISTVVATMANIQSSGSSFDPSKKIIESNPKFITTNAAIGSDHAITPSQINRNSKISDRQRRKRSKGNDTSSESEYSGSDDESSGSDDSGGDESSESESSRSGESDESDDDEYD